MGHAFPRAPAALWIRERCSWEMGASDEPRRGRNRNDRERSTMTTDLTTHPESAGLQQKIRELIVSGEFEMGAKLSEEQLAKRFGIGKATVRHALGSLAAVGLIDVRPRIGSFIFSLNVEEFDQLNAAREVLECAAVRIAMQSNGQAFLREMQKNVEAAAVLTPRGDYHRDYRILDRAFHMIPFVHAKNKYLGTSKNLHL